MNYYTKHNNNWPSTLDFVAVYLKSCQANYYTKMMLKVHHESHPGIQVIYKDQNTFYLKVIYNWFMGYSKLINYKRKYYANK